MKAVVAEKSGLREVFLVYYDQYEARLNDPAKRGSGRGMDPKLLQHLVQLAHHRGLKVPAHIYSVEDFRPRDRAGVACARPHAGHDSRLRKVVDRYR